MLNGNFHTEIPRGFAEEVRDFLDKALTPDLRQAGRQTEIPCGHTSDFRANDRLVDLDACSSARGTDWRVPYTEVMK